MNEWWSVEYVREKNASALEEAEERRLARLATGTNENPSLRARGARPLFGFAGSL